MIKYDLNRNMKEHVDKQIASISTSIGPGVGVSPVIWTGSRTWVRGK